MTGKKLRLAAGLSATVFVVVTAALVLPAVSAQSVPDWVKTAALWYGQDKTSEAEFLSAIKFLIESGVIVLEGEDAAARDSAEKPTTANIIIPNGNANVEHTGFYIPLNLEVEEGTTVVWVNEDAVQHTVQSLDETGNIVGLFNSAPLQTGERFSYDFNEDGVYHYYCSLHPWRVGQVTVR